MRALTFEHLQTTRPARARTPDEDLIEQIVAACTFRKSGQDRELAKLLAITAKTAKWTTADLHALYQKRLDPSIRSYSAFVTWSAKVTKK